VNDKVAWDLSRQAPLVITCSFPLHLNSVTTDVATTTKTLGTQPLDEGVLREETRVRWGGGRIFKTRVLLKP